MDFRCKVDIKNLFFLCTSSKKSNKQNLEQPGTFVCLKVPPQKCQQSLNQRS